MPPLDMPRPIRWLRSWPQEPPAHRAHVADELERLVIAHYDYRPLLDMARDVDADICLLEWDVALDATEREVFERHVWEQPGWPLVAPYRLRLPDRPRAVWAHRLCMPPDDGSNLRYIGVAEQFCHYPAFGLIYLPRRVLLDYAAHGLGQSPAPYLRDIPGADLRSDVFTDHSFAVWLHHYTTMPPTRVAWDIRPVHLH